MVEPEPTLEVQQEAVVANTPKRSRSWRGQFGIADLLLMFTVVAAWTAYFVSRDRVQSLEDQIQRIQETVGELVVEDATQYNAIAQTAARFTTDIWQVYLPKGHAYELHLATEGITALTLPQSQARVPISSGMHHISLDRARADENHFRVKVVVDGERKLEMLEARIPGVSDSNSSSGVAKRQEKLPVDQPLVLKRLRSHLPMVNNMTAAPPDDVGGNGTLLWIQSLPASSP